MFEAQSGNDNEEPHRKKIKPTQIETPNNKLTEQDSEANEENSRHSIFNENREDVGTGDEVEIHIKDLLEDNDTDHLKLNKNEENTVNHLEDKKEFSITENHMINEEGSLANLDSLSHKNVDTDTENDENHSHKENNDDDSASVSSADLNKLENEAFEETEKENIQEQKTEEQNLDLASTSNYSKPLEIIELETKLNKFLDLVKHAVLKSQFEDVIVKKCLSIKKYFDKCGMNANEKSFIKLLNDCTFSTQEASAAGATIAFHKIYEHLKLLSAKSKAEVMPEDVHRVQKLEKLLTSLMRKIHKLEKTEVNFDDEEDSSYMQVDRYKTRVKKVYESYCELINKNPNSGRLTYEKLNFEKSSYKEVNDAINKKYKNSLNFPSYCEMEQFIRAVVKERRLDVSESRVKSESKKCFKALGKILQKRRRAELYDCHLGFIEGTDDPASEDVSLDETLKKNSVEGAEKFNQLLHSYNVLAEKSKEDDNVDDCSGEEASE